MQNINTVYTVCVTDVNKTTDTFLLSLSVGGRHLSGHSRLPLSRFVVFLIGLQLHLHRVVVTDTQSLGEQINVIF